MKSFHMPVRKRTQKGLKVSNVALLLRVVSSYITAVKGLKSFYINNIDWSYNYHANNVYQEVAPVEVYGKMKISVLSMSVCLPVLGWLHTGA